MRHRFLTAENREWWTLGAVSFGLFMIMLDNTVVNVAVPAIERDLGAGLSQLEWIVSGYALTFAALMLTGGKLADRWLRHRRGRASAGSARRARRRVTGIEQSPSLVEVAQRLADEEGVGERTEFRVGDAHALDVADESIDAVVAHTTMSHVTDP
jgi:hypothetical protein